MDINAKQELTANEIEKLSSHYLNYGRKQESWKIDNVIVENEKLSAKVSMTSLYLSQTDEKGFHLTIFSTLEFLSQLLIIYGHVWAGLKEKTQEGWMVESSIRTTRAIRNPENIRVVMQVRTKKVGVHLYGMANCEVTDDQGGLFEVMLKGFLS